MNTYTITLTAGEALFLWCLRNGKTIAQLARAIGQPRQRTSDILRGYAIPTDVCKAAIDRETKEYVRASFWSDYARDSIKTLATPGEHLITLVRRKGITIAEFCKRSDTDTTRISRIIHGGIPTPTKREQAAIAKQFKELRGKWNAPK